MEARTMVQEHENSDANRIESIFDAHLDRHGISHIF